ncbi:uncharacterized protein LY89DRAFT_571761 [Mollisia scopiformis]|uniref:Uncharacterized protein n=1 Tax=Mollisia scopiformis TaxID=149040 RepID=A0A194XW06_MOLSC|nr:uncharacterized protein LY89DRAFT_571761 [Mollisia scopiformis]KUJ24199.1 hypothetical protein LY89DRAFT_571761 [Mollisia scopiformis]
MASSITAAVFKDALSRYGTVLKGMVKTPAKEGQTSLEELDKFRYQYAPMNFSMNAGKTLDSEALQKLAEWKVRHGKFRPALQKHIASNNDEGIASATTEAFEHYASNKDNIAGTIEKLTVLKGVGPATATLILSVHDPQNVIFFSDELYRWLVKDGEDVSLKYTTKEFEEVFSKAKAFMSRIKCTPTELEKAAFTLIQENEPEPKPKKEPSGRGRGRPPLADSEKKPKKVTVPGRGRGRPAGTTKAKTEDGVAPKAKKEKKVAAVPAANGETKNRGRPAKKVESKPESESGAEEGEEEEAKTPASKKRKSTATPASDRKTKKTKA